jgi:hypothetical protein
MRLGLATPGVYREDSFAAPPAELPTGVPGFVGFGQARNAAGDPSDEPQLLRHVDQLLERWVPPADGPSYLAAAVDGFFTNGGVRCYVVGAGAASGGAAALSKALESLGPLLDLDLVAVPDAMTLSDAEARSAQHAALAHCARQSNRFALLDAPRVSSGIEASTELALLLDTWKASVLASGSAADGADGALYFPWLRPLDASAPVPPCGHVAGVVARSDARVGVFKAPANEELFGVIDLDFAVDAMTQAELNPRGINCLRAFPGRGLRVWGARTLSSDASWQYVNVRRLFLTLSRWASRNLSWAAFEPNSPRLWNRIQRELGVYLASLWRAGALKGATSADAYFVKCDAETNPNEVREQGQVVTQVGLAPALPGEFVVVHIVHRPGSTELS